MISYAIQVGKRVEVYEDNGWNWNCEGQLQGFSTNTVVVKMWGYNQISVYGCGHRVIKTVS